MASLKAGAQVALHFLSAELLGILQDGKLVIRASGRLADERYRHGGG